MAKTLFAVSAAAFIVACVAGWAAIPTSQARVAEAATLDPFKMMTSASTSQTTPSCSEQPPHFEPRPRRGFFLGPLGSAGSPAVAPFFD